METSITLGKVIQNFITSRTADGRAPNTIRDYWRVLEPFQQWCHQSEITLSILDKGSVRRYVASLRERGWSEGTVAIHVRNLRAFLRWCCEEGYIGENLAKAVKAPKRTRRVEMPLTEDEIKKLLDTCERPKASMSCHTPLVTIEMGNLRDKAIILFLYDTGLRVGEVVQLRCEHLFRDKAGTFLLVYAPKTNTARPAVLGNWATLALLEYLEARGNSLSAPLFATLYNRDKALGHGGISKLLRRRAELAGIDPVRVHPHIFRKAFVTSSLDNGMDAERVRVLAGWKSLEMPSLCRF
jgi:site-specific recombinase XerD